jgi:hypothetical protein
VLRAPNLHLPPRLFTCSGCEKDFFMRHANEHRHELGKQTDEFTLDHDKFRQKLTEQITQSPYYPNLKQKIDQWEQQFIDKIHQAADDIRKDLDNMIKTQLTDVLIKLAHEINMRVKKMNILRPIYNNGHNNYINYLTKLPTFDIQQDKNVIPVISKIFIELEDNDQIIVHSEIASCATIRGKSEYLCGQHRLRLKLEEYHSLK